MSTNHPENADQMPEQARQELEGIKGLFTGLVEAGAEPEFDPNSERIIEELERVSDKLEEERKNPERYLFDQMEFVDSLNHVVTDQLSALKKEKISSQEWSARFNRWFVFCDAVVNMGIICLYSNQAMKKEEYETVFKTLRISKTFETVFLKPRGIRVALSHKSKMVKGKYPWLAMPVLIVKDEAGVEHEIAITPSPRGAVWWLDVLIGFHGSYDWIMPGAEEYEGRQEGEEKFPQPTTIDQPLAPLENEKVRKDE